MRRNFTVELTTREALTVHRMARLAGVTPDRIVQLLYKKTTFATVVEMATSSWQYYDD